MESLSSWNVTNDQTSYSKLDGSCLGDLLHFGGGFSMAGILPGIGVSMGMAKLQSATIRDTTDCFTCSFTEFMPFCFKLYYFSSYKAF